MAASYRIFIKILIVIAAVVDFWLIIANKLPSGHFLDV